MISSMQYTGFTIVALSVMLISVVWTDVKTHRISNAMVIMIVLLGLCFQLLANGVNAVVMQGLAGMAVGLGVFLPFYIAGGMGAGDVKLMAGIGTILGPFSTLIAGSAALVAGAPLALYCLAQRSRQARKLEERAAAGMGTNRIAPAMPHAARKERFPYAAAIAVGTIAGLWHSGQLQELIGAIV